MLINPLRPSLLRRVLLAVVVVGFGLVWVALLAYGYREATDTVKRDEQQQAFGDGLLQSLSNTPDAEQARMLVSAFESRINESRRLAKAPGEFGMQLWDRERHTRVYATPGVAQVPWREASSPSMWTAPIGQADFHFYQGQTDRWRLQIASPLPETAWLLWMLAKNLAPNLLIAFPLVVVPLWLALAYGLRPLRGLSELIAARGVDDLSTLPLQTPQAELQPLVASLNGLMARLSQKIKREHAFVQDAAHELRTPFAVISAQAHVLAKAGLPQEKQAAERQLDDAIARASHLVRQLLDLAQMDADAQRTPEPVDIAQEARTALAERASLAATQHIELSLEAPDHFPQQVDRLALHSVLNNLLDNAIRHGTAPGRPGQVAIHLSLQQRHWKLAVLDDGPGIAPDQRALVFERFYRQAGQRQSGAGLGLAIVKRAASRMGGEVSIGPGLQGRGCGFTVQLPLPGDTTGRATTG
jgi:two-component system sensor histidine kinase QseC